MRTRLNNGKKKKNLNAQPLWSTTDSNEEEDLDDFDFTIISKATVDKHLEESRIRSLAIPCLSI